MEIYIHSNEIHNVVALIKCLLRGVFKLWGILFFLSGMEADRNVKVVGEDVAIL